MTTRPLLDEEERALRRLRFHRDALRHAALLRHALEARLRVADEWTAALDRTKPDDLRHLAYLSESRSAFMLQLADAIEGAEFSREALAAAVQKLGLRGGR